MDDEGFQVSRLTATSTRVLQDLGEEVSDCYSFLASLGKGDFRSFKNIVLIFKGNLQNDPGNYAVMGLISVLRQQGKSGSKVHLTRKGSGGNTARAKQRGCGENMP